MPARAKRKVAILGGGMAGLTAAYELSRTAELRAAFEVTIYQMGWRLGGKCATGRDTEGRILEHGLHFWFGCYENAFRLLREVLGALGAGPKQPLRDFTDALRPHSFTPIGTLTAPQAFWPVTWPIAGGTPGDGGLLPGLNEMVGNIVRALGTLLENIPAMKSYLAQDSSSIPAKIQAEQFPSEWFGARGGNFNGLPIRHAGSVLWLLGRIGEIARGTFQSTNPMTPALHVLICFVRGVVVDLLLNRKHPQDLCDLDFRDWLIAHGCDREVARDADVLRAFYDMVMQYQDGEVTRPSMAAGDAIVVWLRMLCTTKGSMMWELQAGMGDAVVAPIYRLLLRNGVRFNFFRRVTSIELARGQRRIGKIHLSRQVNLKRKEYHPTITIGGLTCWPAEPLWEQIVDGPRMAAQRVDFESRYCRWPSTGSEQLVHERDFHEAVLAIPLGAFKKLGHEPQMCDELALVNPEFHAMTANIGLIPTQAMQVWCDSDPAELGWTAAKPATVGGQRPFSIWAEMGQSLRFEPWTREARKPKSVYYFCGVFPLSGENNVAVNSSAIERAPREVKRAGIQWLAAHAPSMWPNAIGPRGQFDWRVLHSRSSARGVARFDSQYWRANVDPGERCPGSAAGTTRYRLAADNSGFDNLFLAGCWVKTGLNTASVESAVMAGTQAARAISGSSREVWGERLSFGR